METIFLKLEKSGGKNNLKGRPYKKKVHKIQGSFD